MYIRMFFDYYEVIYQKKKSKRSKRGANFYQLLSEIIRFNQANQIIVTLQTDSNYSSQLKSIVDQTDKQLVIWKDQQRILLDEYSRKPKLIIEAKEIKIIKD